MPPDQADAGSLAFEAHHVHELTHQEDAEAPVAVSRGVAYSPIGREAGAVIPYLDREDVVRETALHGEAARASRVSVFNCIVQRLTRRYADVFHLIARETAEQREARNRVSRQRDILIIAGKRGAIRR